MKAYSIGREVGCDIVINDNTDVISRRHAILNVNSNGKMTIVDQSHNGTYVNGIRISPNVPVPVTRKDTISFAHVARLDWDRVPNPFSPIRWVLVGFGCLVVVVAVAFGVYQWTGNGHQTTQTEASANPNNGTVAPVDSIGNKEEKKDTTDKKDDKTKVVGDKNDTVKDPNAGGGKKPTPGGGGKKPDPKPSPKPDKNQNKGDSPSRGDY